MNNASRRPIASATKCLLPIAAVALVAGCATPRAIERGTVEYISLTPGGSRAGSGALGVNPAPPHAASTTGASTRYIAHASAREAVAARHHGSIVRVEPIWGARSETRVASATTRGAPARGRPLTRASDAVEEPAVAPEAMSEEPSTEGEVPIVAPYSLRRIFRGFGECRGDHHFHEAIDIGGVGPDLGLGTPVRSMTRARVKFIGRPEDRPGEFGRRDRRKGTTVRGGHKLPRSKVVPGYGRVYFFTRDHGRWRSGVIVVTEGVGGELDQHEIRYMHLGAVRPDLKVGELLEPGEELGVMGGTAVQQSSPHVHIDIENPEGKRIDVAPLLGLAPTARPCPEPGPDGKVAKVWTTAVEIDSCAHWSRSEDFDSGEYYAHDINLPLSRGDRFEVELVKAGGRWKPRLEVYDGEGVSLYNGSVVPPRGRGRGVIVKRRLSGRNGPKAVVRVEAREDTEVRLRVTAWPSQRRGPLLPSDGSYELTIDGRCPARDR